MTRLDQKRKNQCYMMCSPVYDQSGEGIGDILSGFMRYGSKAGKYLWNNKENIAKVASAGYDLYKSDTGTQIKNSFQGNEKSFPGEAHAILKLPNGKMGMANYTGPGTEVVKRLKRGDKGKTPVDDIAKMHDIEYALAQDAKTKRIQQKLIRNADNRMLDNLQKVNDSAFNKRLGQSVIQGKVLAEDLNLLDKGKFSGDLKKLSQSDKELLLRHQQSLEQNGMGLLPGDELKLDLLKKSLKDKKGGGLKLAGVQGFVTKHVMPHILSQLNINIPGQQVKKVIQAAMPKSGDVKQVSNKLAHAILPLLTIHKLNQLKKTDMLKGGGLDDIYGDKKKGLLDNLGGFIYSLVKKYFVSQGEKRGIRPIFFGGGGKSFWESFLSGFKTIFKPFATIGGVLLDAAGMPEFGVPLQTLGGLV